MEKAVETVLDIILSIKDLPAEKEGEIFDEVSTIFGVDRTKLEKETLLIKKNKEKIKAYMASKKIKNIEYGKIKISIITLLLSDKDKEKAFMFLGMIYYLGIGVDKSIQKALDMFLSAMLKYNTAASLIIKHIIEEENDECIHCKKDIYFLIMRMWKFISSDKNNEEMKLVIDDFEFNIVLEKKEKLIIGEKELLERIIKRINCNSIDKNDSFYYINKNGSYVEGNMIKRNISYGDECLINIMDYLDCLVLLKNLL